MKLDGSDREPGTGPMIAFARSDVTIPWSNKYGTLLELAGSCDVPVRWSCRTGVCKPARRPSSRDQLDTTLIRWNPRPMEAYSSAAHSPATNVVLDL
jgi:hypothetical protein